MRTDELAYEIRFEDQSLIPVVVQDHATREVLMLAYANAEAVRETARTRFAHYWSRSRNELWMKGKTSGNVQRVVEILVDCDGDALLYRVRQEGPACHLGKRTCFHLQLKESSTLREDSRTDAPRQDAEARSPSHRLGRESSVGGRGEFPAIEMHMRS